MANLNTRFTGFTWATSMHYYILNIEAVLVQNFWGFHMLCQWKLITTGV